MPLINNNNLNPFQKSISQNLQNKEAIHENCFKKSPNFLNDKFSQENINSITNTIDYLLHKNLDSLTIENSKKESNLLQDYEIKKNNNKNNILENLNIEPKEDIPNHLNILEDLNIEPKENIPNNLNIKLNNRDLKENNYGKTKTKINIQISKYYKEGKNSYSEITSQNKKINNLFINNEIEISFLGKKEIIKNPKKMFITFGKRTFNFPIKDLNKIYCERITITEYSKINNLIIEMRSISKSTIYFFVFIFLWIYILIFIKTIYRQYGGNIFQICVLPLISMIFIKLLIEVNFFILITTIILHFKGKEYINNFKKKLVTKIIFKIFVPAPAISHYSAIITYQNLIKYNFKKNKNDKN